MLVIDGSYVWYAARAPLADAIPLPGAYNVPRVLRKLLRDTPEPYLIVWDHEKLAKQRLYAGYKKGVDLPWTVNAKDYTDTIRLCHWLGAPQVQRSGWEADEAIAWWTRRLSASIKVTVVSNDRDLMQLLGPRVDMYRYTEKDWVTAAAVEKPDIFGWAPEYVSSAQALMGDSGDRVPGLFSERETKHVLDNLGPFPDWLGDGSAGAIARAARDLPDTEIQKKLTKLATEVQRNWLLVDLSDPTLRELHKGDRPALLPAPARGNLEKANAYAKRKKFQYLDGKADAFSALQKFGQEAVKIMGHVKTSEAVLLRFAADDDEPSPMEILERAMAEGKQVKLVYRRLDGSSDTYTVAPYQVCLWGPRRRSKVLFAHDVPGGRTKSFLIANIQAVELLEVKYRPPRGGEVFPKTVKTPARCDWKPRRRGP